MPLNARPTGISELAIALAKPIAPAKKRYSAFMLKAIDVESVSLRSPTNTPTDNAEPTIAPSTETMKLSSANKPKICLFVAPITVSFAISVFFSFSLIRNNNATTATPSTNTAPPASTTGAVSDDVFSSTYASSLDALTSIVEYFSIPLILPITLSMFAPSFSDRYISLQKSFALTGNTSFDAFFVKHTNL